MHKTFYYVISIYSTICLYPTNAIAGGYDSFESFLLLLFIQIIILPILIIKRKIKVKYKVAGGTVYFLCLYGIWKIVLIESISTIFSELSNFNSTLLAVVILIFLPFGLILGLNLLLTKISGDY